ncbi:hypothetical protein NW766_010496 [Fusarium irregulare]|uniref:Arrestin-like N-terminal domain-containing protein n=1 Tax=Fusarium irregulare TaxID=2494466 RepID=A0A9W8PGV5_9HYPO|nr:hypothetical protein NW766_010496 [Fusarium irregulare]
MEPPSTERGSASFQKRPGPKTYTSFRDIKHRKRREDGITISIEDHTPSKLYRTGSIVKGVVEIKPKIPFHYTRISIKLLCESSVHLSGRYYETFHRLLNLDMPVEERLVPRVENGYWTNCYLHAAQPYTVPFSFELCDPHDCEACPHEVASSGVSELHRRLPPSLAGIDRDAMVPQGIRISYTIVATLVDRSWLHKEIIQAASSGYFKHGFDPEVQSNTAAEIERFLRQPRANHIIRRRTSRFSSSGQWKKLPDNQHHHNPPSGIFQKPTRYVLQMHRLYHARITNMVTNKAYAKSSTYHQGKELPQRLRASCERS